MVLGIKRVFGRGGEGRELLYSRAAAKALYRSGPASQRAKDWHVFYRMDCRANRRASLGVQTAWHQVKPLEKTRRLPSLAQYASVYGPCKRAGRPWCPAARSYGQDHHHHSRPHSLGGSLGGRLRLDGTMLASASGASRSASSSRGELVELLMSPLGASSVPWLPWLSEPSHRCSSSLLPSSLICSLSPFPQSLPVPQSLPLPRPSLSPFPQSLPLLSLPLLLLPLRPLPSLPFASLPLASLLLISLSLLSLSLPLSLPSLDPEAPERSDPLPEPTDEPAPCGKLTVSSVPLLEEPFLSELPDSEPLWSVNLRSRRCATRPSRAALAPSRRGSASPWARCCRRYESRSPLRPAGVSPPAEAARSATAAASPRTG